MVWKVDDNTPDYARSSAATNPQALNDKLLDVPPKLRKELELLMPDQVANTARGDVKMSAEEKAAVAGKAVSLDTRLYNVSAPAVFSAVLSSMTALNLPMKSVDSPSATITSDWIRPNANTSNAYIDAVAGAFGKGPTIIKYRFIVRVFRAPEGQTELQVRTLGQQFINAHWVNRAIKANKANDIFSAVEERIGVQQPNAAPATADESATTH
ncbi:MAG: hypothetical protein R8K53_04240 [Mariprofundaceae bacterium]